jgi:hypothetical protein
MVYKCSFERTGLRIRSEEAMLNFSEQPVGAADCGED